MRYRTIHPPFWSDKIMGKLGDSTRLIFIGIWMLSDDAGWSEWDPEQMATELFPWQAVRAREQRFRRAAEELRLAGRVIIHDCGHAQVPSLHIYQKPGRPYYAIRDAHERHCRALSPVLNDRKRLEAISSDSASEGKGSEVKGKRSAPAREARPAGPDGPVSLDSAMESVVPGLRARLKEHAGG